MLNAAEFLVVVVAVDFPKITVCPFFLLLHTQPFLNKTGLDGLQAEADGTSPYSALQENLIRYPRHCCSHF